MGTFKQMMIGLLPFMMAQKNLEQSVTPISTLGYDNMPLRGVWHQSPIYHPKRKKLKGWQKENKRKNYHK